MTEYQRRIFNALKRGSQLRWEVSGFYFQHQKLRVETSDALIETGELAMVRVEGKFFPSDFIVHRSRVDVFSVGRKVLEVRVPFLCDGKVRK